MNYEQIGLKFPSGTKDRIKAFCRQGRSMTDVILLMISLAEKEGLDNLDSDYNYSVGMDELIQRIDRLETEVRELKSNLDNLNNLDQDQPEEIITKQLEPIEPSHDDIMLEAIRIYNELGSWSKVASELNNQKQFNHGRRWVANAIRDAVSQWRNQYPSTPQKP